MFKQGTLFVLGAGASCEADMPSGTALKQHIANLLDIRFPDGYHQDTGDFQITELMRREGQQKGDPHHLNHLINKAWAIRDGMSMALSIDNYLDAHRGDADLKFVGKLAVAKSILAAEARSHFHPTENLGLNADLSYLGGTWFVRFQQLLTEGIPKDNVVDAVSRVSIITFNYDRTLEHFLRQSLKSYYQLSDRDAADHVNGMVLHHPYGTVGPLPWQRLNGGVNFGTERANLLEIAAGLRTFTEEIQEADRLAAIRETVQSSRNIVFLGFGFHRQNVELLAPEYMSRRPTIYATVLGISRPNQSAIAANLRKAFGKGPPNARGEYPDRQPKVEMLETNCLGLLNEFSMALTEN